MKIETTIPVGDPTTRAAERLLERKRMGLESAIEALETVGYAVTSLRRACFSQFFLNEPTPPKNLS